MQYRSNWCWAAACKMVGQQYKKINTKYTFVPHEVNDILSEKETDACAEKMWQCAIVKNANTIMPGCIENFSGDDEAKIRGIKYAVTGDCFSEEINVVNLGTYDMPDSLWDLYGEEIKAVFKSKNYIIGNAVLYPQGICHSFVLMSIAENMVQIYDPWDGNTYFYDIHEVFETGFVSAKGIGIIKWIQFIDNNTRRRDCLH